jgi:four helix bundle protein
MDIAVNCFKLTDSFPATEKFGISSQINRAGVSIPSNVAEGSSRTSENENGRFIEISLGSSFELETQLLIAQRLNFGDETKVAELISNVSEEQKILAGFLKSLSR